MESLQLKKLGKIFSIQKFRNFSLKNQEIQRTLPYCSDFGFSNYYDKHIKSELSRIFCLSINQYEWLFDENWATADNSQEGFLKRLYILCTDSDLVLELEDQMFIKTLNMLVDYYKNIDIQKVKSYFMSSDFSEPPGFYLDYEDPEYLITSSCDTKENSKNDTSNSHLEIDYIVSQMDNKLFRKEPSLNNFGPNICKNLVWKEL
jgi:hypothetical protein